MVSKELSKFFQAIEFNDHWSFFSNSKFNVQYYHHNQQAIINLEISKFLPVKVLAELEQKVKKMEYKLRLEFRVLESKYDFELIKEYFDYIKIYKLHLLAGIYADLPFDAFTYKDSNLIIRVPNSTAAKLISKELSSFVNYFSRYGFKNLKIKVNSDLSLPELPSLDKELAEELTKVKVSSSASRTRTTRSYGSYNNSKIDLVNEENTHKIAELIGDESDVFNSVVVTGTVLKITKFFTKNKKWFYTLLVTDYEQAISVKAFLATQKQETLVMSIKEKDTIKIYGQAKYDTYAKEHVLWLNDFVVVPALQKTRIDSAKEKRVEFHVHTKMSAMDGVSDASQYVQTAGQWGHKAIAFSDHLNLQAYPEIYATAKKFPNLKVIYGVEMDLVADFNIVHNANNGNLDDLEYLVFDLETTGLSVNYHEIIEFGYVVIKNGAVIEQNTILIKPETPVTSHITELTSIDNEMLADKPMLKDKINEIKAILANRVLVAHNANFDMGFLKAAFKKFDFPVLDNPVVDTLQLARVLKPELKYYRLGTVCRAFSVKYDSETAHRADYDANVLAQVFLKMLVKIKTEQNLVELTNFKELCEEKITNKVRGEHITVYAKNQTGLKNLYQLVSDSHTSYFYKTPKIVREALEKYRDNLLIGSACVNGSVFETAMNKSTEELIEKLKWFDFIEVQPPSVYRHLVLRNNLTETQLHEVIKKIITCAKEMNKIVVATSDAHYVEPYQKIFRSIIINNKGIGGVAHPLFDYKKQDLEYPDQHLRTTNEMLAEFSFLADEALTKEIVVTNTNLLADQFEKVEAIKSGLYTPEIVDVDKKLRDLCFTRAWELYGNPLPEIIENRLKKELDAIITHGFAVVYWIAHKLVAQSLADGYLVGSRGSVGSSLVATLANITEVNPLQPHYLCLQCHYCEFVTDGVTKCGYDLSEKLCPKCNIELTVDGHDIPFETFLGFDGDKTPDIDLNFSGEYQLKAHDFTKQMFGENNVFRAGTISTVASKTAYGFTKNFVDQTGFKSRNATIEWLSEGCTGIKRTTGQHPGGIIVVPKKYDITDFTPINYPADDTSSTWKTTHFDFEAIHDNLLKLDILGHVDPTALRMLHDLTGVDPKTIPNHDDKVLSLFSNLSALNITNEDLNGENTGAIGIPEFGTGFVRKMLLATKPNSFAELVQISGLSHGTDVWINNAELLIAKEGLKLKDVIGCRDDIMTYLMYQKLPAKVAFSIMEDVRKGKGLKPEYEKLMQQHHVPNWYIDSCKKIKYMFPKAHATAYVLMAWRVAWYKVYYPHEYYATYFTTRADIFDIETMLAGKSAIAAKLKDINNRLGKESMRSKTLSATSSVSQKEKDLVPMLEVALEMYARGISFVNLDIEKSETKTFQVVTIEKQKFILPAFIVLDGLGEVNAQSIVEARKLAAFKSIEDLRERTNITRTNSIQLKELKVLAHLPETTVVEQENVSKTEEVVLQ
ncbi:PolC-type DNA polymerase III [Spiroplasma platyhelix]|uniref:DNA polymerase III PolC-type n=1 Tax=Spiroplasma platyhelix PALS-1 TaxID=1276218 RepID=A0A846TS17_9MOLU|nr:PolC-type DNA polymerase III [Spiroplasma platyhelix]MBE4703922.1 DNA polymerase III PolC-type [Spiroplasma platyhelix PALS-1]NKE38295.1 PolC-type DNA polymerase III [Spiroplasma platyhelix PALS-1]UJB29180.1 DNA polymerase III subunit alpha (PolC) [Spiroplasma platyhelix PALS-1]